MYKQRLRQKCNAHRNKQCIERRKDCACALNECAGAKKCVIYAKLEAEEMKTSAVHHKMPKFLM